MKIKAIGKVIIFIIWLLAMVICGTSCPPKPQIDIGSKIVRGPDRIVQTMSWNKPSGHTQIAEIDWNKQIIKATGIGITNPKAPNAAIGRAGCARAASVVAQRNILEIIRYININSETTVEEWAKTSPDNENRLQILKGAHQVGDIVYNADNTCEATFVVAMSADLYSFLLPPSDKFGNKINQIPTGPNKAYTGLIIDATGLEAVPSMAPRIINKGGDEIYGISYISQNQAVRQGVVGYSSSVDEAGSNDRVGSNPLLLKAVGVSGSRKIDIVVSDDDAAKFKDPGADCSFLKNGRVIIVL